ncbi:MULTISPECIES: hypothetical protein [Nostocales]|nr:hypothetical protein [Tolypothrix bouteillei]
MLSRKSAQKAIALVFLFNLPGGVTLSSEACLQISPLGNYKVFALVPAPQGFPEGIAVENNTVYVCASAIAINFLHTQSFI